VTSSQVDGGQRSRAGFTMIEVIIAITVLAVGVLGLAGTTAYIVRQVTLADVMTERTAALQTVIERVQAMPFDSVSAGSDSVGSFAV
jgi:prepilin-type N-terminal cleavage/methylation domain-containing protein